MVSQAKVRFGKVFANMYFPSGGKYYYSGLKGVKGAFVYCYGLPAAPFIEPAFRDFLVGRGFLVIVPHYIGTYDSFGLCNFSNCVDTVLQTIRFLEKGRGRSIWHNKTIKWKVGKIILGGNSWGADVANVAAAKSRAVRKSVSVSGVYTYKNFQRGEETPGHVKRVMLEGWRNTWRVEPKAWQKFLRGEFDVNSTDYLDGLKDKDMFILHARGDPDLNWGRAKSFYAHLKLRKGKGEKFLVITNEKDHVGMGSLLQPSVLGKFVRWLE